jgi:hypothetical protein
LYFKGDARLYIIGLCLFLLNFFIGLLLMNEGLFHYDSIVLAQAVERTFQTGRLQPAVWGRYGSVLVNAILYWPFYLAGQNAEHVTLLSGIIFHSLSIAVLLLFIFELSGNRIQAVFGALLLSFTPFYFAPNTFGKEHGMCLFFLLLSLYLLIAGKRRGSLWLIGLSSFFYGFSVAVRETALLLLPVYFLLYFNPDTVLKSCRSALPKDRSDRNRLLVLLLPVSIVLTVLFLTYLAPVIYKAFFQPSTSVAGFMGLWSPKLKFAISNMFRSVPAVLFLFFVVGVFRLIKEKKPSLLAVLVLWTLMFFIVGNASNYKPRFLDIVIVPFYIIVSFGLAWTYRSFKIVAIALAACCALTMFFFMYPMLSFRHHYNGEKQVALYLRSLTEKNAVIIATDQRPFIEYYGHRTVETIPFGSSQLTDVFLARVEGYLRKGVPVYFTENPWYINVELSERELLMKYFRLAIVGEILNEDSHNAELDFRMDIQKIYRVSSLVSLSTTESQGVANL